MIALLAAAPLAAQDRVAQQTDLAADGLLLQLGAGGFDAVRQDDIATHGAFRAALRPRRFGIRPVAGLFATSDESVYGYVGAAREFPLSRRFLLTPQFSAGAYTQGDGKDLGYGLEFLSSLELSCRLGNGSRIGLAYQHISNGSISDDNPGAEIVLLTWTWPLHRQRF
ncbi:MAG: acyloxyacyl hydrolase [Thermoanaerobaculia bacterium]